MGLKVPTLTSQAGSTDNQPLPLGAFQKSPIDMTKTLSSLSKNFYGLGNSEPENMDDEDQLYMRNTFWSSE